MREIKFRAWDTVKKVMYSAYELGQDQEALLPDGRGFANISGDSTRLTQIHSHLLPLQYTGLKDKNDKEVYEGDIFWWSRFSTHPVEVYWDDRWGGWRARANGEMQFDKTYDISPVKFQEVIGNIYENKELLNA